MAQVATPLPRTSADIASELARTKPQNQWQLAWRRFRRNKAALVSAGIVVLYVVVAMLSSVIAPHNPVKDNSGKDYLPPVFIAQSPAGKSPDPTFILGTDNLGRDVFSRILYGGRTSLTASLIPVVVVVLVGVSLGFLAGLLGGRIDNFLMRITDVFYAFPAELILILFTVTLGDTALGKAMNGLLLLLLGIAVVSWSGLARLMRGQALSLKNREFVDAARSMGASTWHIMLRHILPNSLNVLVVWIALAIPRYILTEAFLGYLGLGLRPALDPGEFFVTSWGRMLLEGYSNQGSQPWYLLCTAFAVAVLVISFTFLGDGLRDALDPKEKQ